MGIATSFGEESGEQAWGIEGGGGGTYGAGTYAALGMRMLREMGDTAADLEVSGDNGPFSTSVGDRGHCVSNRDVLGENALFSISLVILEKG